MTASARPPYPIAIQHDAEAGCWIAHCPDLADLAGRAATPAAALARLDDAVATWLDQAHQAGAALPHPSAHAVTLPVTAAYGSLAELRRRTELSQEAFAREIGLDQPRWSRAERRGDHRVSFLQRIIRALGGRLELYARFPGGVVRLDL
jgi:predicted RNase H-like HicB family nuclease